MSQQYDAILVVSFGGPERNEDVIPFLENVLRGKNVPHERMMEVAEHYYEFGGKSPINEQNRAFIAALVHELNQHGHALPVYWGNRNWHPLLPDTLKQMSEDGIGRALAFVTSSFSSYSGCRQYREDIERARQDVGPAAPAIDKLRMFYNHPGFIEPLVESVASVLLEIPAEDRSQTQIVYTAHSIPNAMAANCDYEKQLQEACRLVSQCVEHENCKLVYQSRSGPPQQPWLEPDVCDHLRAIARQGEIRNVIILPIGFVSEHLEVLYDIDTEAKQVCDEVGLKMFRAETVGTHPRFITMVRELIEERLSESPKRLALGECGPSHDVCPEDCCSYVPRRPPGK